MKLNDQLIRVVVAFLLLSAFCLSAAPQKNAATPVFHNSLGAVIDSTENARYNIFGNIAGFSAARLVRVGENKTEIYFLRQLEDRAQLLIYKMPSTTFHQFCFDLAARSGAHAGDVFAGPLLAVNESLWKESSPDKKINLHDGSQLVGTLSAVHNDTVVVHTHGGLEINVPAANIAQVRSIGGVANGGPFYRTDPNVSRLFFAPTGRRLDAGAGYFADYWVFFPTAAFGITDYFSFAGGMSLIPNAGSQLVYLLPKFTFELSETAGLGAGLMHLRIPNEIGSFTLGYGVATFGKDTGGVTVAAGLPLGKNAGEGSVLLLGGEKQVTNNIKLISENWFFIGGGDNNNDSVSLFSGGVRFFGDKLAVDLALFTASEAWSEGGFPFMPWVDFSVFWGK